MAYSLVLGHIDTNAPKNEQDGTQKSRVLDVSMLKLSIRFLLWDHFLFCFFLILCFPLFFVYILDLPRVDLGIQNVVGTA